MSRTLEECLAAIAAMEAAEAQAAAAAAEAAAAAAAAAAPARRALAIDLVVAYVTADRPQAERVSEAVRDHLNTQLVTQMGEVGRLREEDWTPLKMQLAALGYQFWPSASTFVWIAPGMPPPNPVIVTVEMIDGYPNSLVVRYSPRGPFD